MKKKARIALFAIIIIGILILLYIPNYKIDKTFTYEIDKEKGEAIITGYLADDAARDRYNDGEDEQLTFPEKIVVPKKIKGYPVKAIGDRAFEWAKAKEIILPDTVEKIGHSAFFHCEELEAISGTDNVEVVEDFGFAGCGKLEELELPKLHSVGESVFSGDENLKEAVFPEGIQVLPYAMCMRMKQLTTVYIPESVETMESRVFAFCDSLEMIHIPPNVTNIHPGTFEGIEDQITIVGVKESYAHEYALKKDIKFIEAEQ